jgi:phosphoserine phosphatase
MSNRPSHPSGLSAADLHTLLELTRHLAAPFELREMLGEVAAAATRVLHAQRSSVWLVDDSGDILVLEVADGLGPTHVPIGHGLLGACARDRQLINVSDCYADPRFDPSMDRETGFRTLNCLSVPLVDHRDQLVGVMQVINAARGRFDAGQEALARALAAQCAVALTRTRLNRAAIEAERLRHELDMARTVQRSALPARWPVLPGYDMHAVFRPAEQTGGDTYDLAQLGGRLLIVLADATGHGIAPALCVAQMQAMLRTAFRLGAGLEQVFTQVNDQLAEVLPNGHFVTAFMGLLDPATHQLRYLSGGQAPILHYRAARGGCEQHGSTSFPMGAMPIERLRPAVQVEMAPGDCLLLISDGLYEQPNPAGECYGRQRVEQIAHAQAGASMAELAAALLDDVSAFAEGAPQDDDMTLVLLGRCSA